MRKVKWGVLGAGGIADRRTIPGLIQAQNAELYAVMEVNEELAEKIRAKWNAKKAYTTAEELINDPEVEVVYIASPVVFHKQQVLLAAKAKKHILVEKPIAMTVEEGQELEKICNDAGILTATGFMMRFNACHQEMKKIISEGKIGQLVSARAQLTCWYPDTPGAWRQSKAKAGGGSLMDMGVHCIDLVEYITGSRTKEVFGFNDTRSFKYDVEDSSNVMIKLENGAVAYIDSHYNIPDEAALCRMEFYGTKGSIFAEGTIGQVDGGKAEVIYAPEKGYAAEQVRAAAERIKIQPTLGNIYTKEVESFSRSVLEGTKVEVPMSDAVWIQKVVDAAYKSGENKTLSEIKY